MNPTTVLHETRDRLRVGVGVGATTGDPALRARIASVPGVSGVRVNRRLGCVVVSHDGRPATRQAVLAALRGATGEPSDGARGGAGGGARAQAHGDARADPRDGTRRDARDDARGDARRRTRRDPAVGERPATGRGARPATGRGARSAAAGPPDAVTLATGAMALAVPLMPRDWRAGGALALVATRIATRPARLLAEPASTLLDAASLAALAVTGHPGVVAASVTMRTLAEVGAARMVRQADALLDRLLPSEGHRHAARRADSARWTPTDPHALRAGDRVRVSEGEVVPVDGWVLSGTASVRPPAHRAAGDLPVGRGDHVPAGGLVVRGRLEVHVEAPTSASRLERMRAHVRHALGAADADARLAPALERMLALPLTGAALVLGLTGDTARSAAMLQADPVQGLDLALPVAREAARVALARHGLLTGGLEAIERLALARVLVLQDTGVLGTGRWRVDAIRTEPGGHEAQVRDWLARLAGWPGELPDGACLSDRQVRSWRREAGLLTVPGGDVILLDDGRLPATVHDRAVDGSVPHEAGGGAVATTPAGAGSADDAPRPVPSLRRRLAFVAGGRVVARIELGCPLRPEVARRLGELAALGFERIAVLDEAAGGLSGTPLPGTEPVPDGPARTAWFDDATRDGTPLVLVHTVFRDLLPPGSVALCPVEADAGAHGVLLGDPLESLASARRAAVAIHRRLRRHRDGAMIANALLMTASALRWAPPLATAVAHHGFAAALLLDSLRIERIGRRDALPPSTTRNDPR